MTTQFDSVSFPVQAIPDHWLSKPFLSQWSSSSSITFNVNHHFGATPVKAPPAPPATVDVGGVLLTGEQVAEAISILEAAEDTKVVPHLTAANHPLAEADFWEISASFGPGGGKVGAKKTATLAALHKAATELNPAPPAPATLPAPPVAAPVEALGKAGYQPAPPPGTGVLTYDEHGYAVNHHRDLWFDSPGVHESERIAQIAAAFGPADNPVVGGWAEEMTCDQQSRWITAWTDGDLRSCFELEAEFGEPHEDHPGRTTPWVTWQAEIIGEVPAGVRVPGNWPSPKSGGDITAGIAEAYLQAAHMQHTRGLSLSYRREWVRYHIRGEARHVNHLSRTAKKHLDKVAKNDYWYELNPAIFPEQPTPRYADLAAYEDLAVDLWPLQAVYDYSSHHQLTATRDTYLGHLDAVLAHRAQALIAEMTAVIDPAPTYTDAPGVTILAGYHRKKVLADQLGHLWLFKPAPDPDHTFRADTEHHAHRLAQRFGYRTADSNLITHDTLYGQVQRMLPVARDLTGVDLTTLTREQLADIAREHLLDWALDNDDCHRQNIVELHDGSIVGIDKGRAWRYFGGWPGLTGDHRADTNCALVYTALYDAIATHLIDQDTTDYLYRAVHARAMRMQRLADTVVAEHVAAAVAHRPHFHPSSYQRVVPGAAGSAEELIAAAVARKNTLVADMSTLWAAVYQRAGWTPPDVSELLGENNDGARLFAGLLDPDLPHAVRRTKSYGTPTFVAGRDIDDAHIMLWREHDHHGTLLYRGETRLNATAGKALSAYCHSHRTRDTPVHDFDAAQNIANGIYRYAHRYLCEGGSGYLMHYVNLLLQTAERMEGDVGAFYLTNAKTLLAAINNGTLNQHHPLVQGVQIYNPEDEPPGDTLRLEPVQVGRTAASMTNEPVLDPDGELRLIHRRLISRGGTDNGYAGNGYLITLPSGDRIEYWPYTDDVRESQKGMLRFTLNPGKPITDGLRAVHAALAEFGLTLNPATTEDLELFYWRHLYGIITNRNDGFSPPFREVRERCTAQHLQKKLHRNPAKENTAWRHAFAAVTSDQQITDWVTAGDHLPRIGHPDLRRPHQAAGRPYWERFDVTADTWSQVPMPGLCYNSGAKWVLYTGACYSTEERLRVLAIWKAGMSSSQDQCYGSSHYLFLRQDREDAKPCTILFSPRVLVRTATYGFHGDLYGRPNERLAHAAFGFAELIRTNSDNNELMVKHSLTVLDDIEVILCNTPEERQDLLNRFAEYAITHIRGVPVEHRVLLCPATTRHHRRALTRALRARR